MADVPDPPAPSLFARTRYVCATANAGKLHEIRAVLGDVVDLMPRPGDVPDVIEDAGTLLGNARLKAAALADATGLPAIADDTGLFVDALGGLPGVDTAYFAGPTATHADNRAKMLAELAEVPMEQRTATFRTIAIVVWPSGDELVAEGTCSGTLARAEVGDHGWGYDPLFIPDEGDGRTFAQMSDDDKNELSHRGRAFRALLARLPV